MARLKSHYRKFRDGGGVHSDTTIDIQVPQENLERPKPEADSSAGDDASRAFQLQIDALRQSEEIQRQRAALAAQAPPALTLREQAFLKANPDFLDDHDIAHKALMQAHQGGHVADSDEFHQAVGKHFRTMKTPPNAESLSMEYLEKMEALGEPIDPVSRVLDEARSPGFAKDTADVSAHDDYNRNRMVSAPVSRDVPSSHYPERPGRITLSVEQKDMARRLNQSEAEYARGLLEMRERDKEYGR